MNICVCGLARSGISASELAAKSGACVTATCLKEDEKLRGEISRLEELGVTVITGRNPDRALLDKTDIVVLSPGVRPDLPFLRDYKGEVIPEIEFAWRFCKATVIGVTGTNGKTTTTTLIARIMCCVNPKSRALGNIGDAFSAYVSELPEDAFAVLELSSFQLESADAFRPHIAVVLQITPDHLDRHKTMENYINAKENIFKNQTRDDFLILNYDDEICRKMAEKANAQVIFFSQKETLENGVFLQDDIIVSSKNNEITKVCPISDLRVLGAHNVENAMAAVGAALAAGVSPETIGKTLGDFTGVAHRIEFTRELDGVKFYNDSKATNPDSAIKGLLAMGGQTVLIGGGYDKNSDFSGWVSLFKGRVSHFIILGAVSEQLEDTCKACAFLDYTRVNSLKDAVSIAYQKSEKGGNVLLSPACASWDMFDDYEQRGNLFKMFVNELS
ncbi:UDP-N-acetylmuramoylalanine--D-glutamate ligase [Clostridia bacterium]|nr:UDP-N-acetylmuramoylalanine--D-glutamate ligase [Clostridia bacterium]